VCVCYLRSAICLCYGNPTHVVCLLYASVCLFFTIRVLPWLQNALAHTHTLLTSVCLIIIHIAYTRCTHIVCHAF